MKQMNSLVTNDNSIVSTPPNNAPIDISVKSAAMGLIKDGKYDEGILNKVEMRIRTHNPYSSCTTHRLDGKFGIKINLVDS